MVGYCVKHNPFLTEFILGFSFAFKEWRILSNTGRIGLDNDRNCCNYLNLIIQT